MITVPSWIMNLKQLFIVFVGMLAALQGPVFGQGGEKGPIDKVLADAIAAVGSPADIAKIRSISASADCVGPKGKYKTTVNSFRSDKTRFEQTYSYKDKGSTVFVNGDLVWETGSAAGELVLSTPFHRMAVRGHEYQKMAFDFQEFFTDFELLGEEVFQSRASVKVRVKDKLGMTVFLFFDKENKRFNGYILQIPDSNETVRNVVLEWRKVGALTLPSVVRATDKTGDWTLNFHTIKLNAANEKLLDIPPRVADMAELLRLHDLQKTAHLTYDAELLVGDSPEMPVSIQRGSVVKRTRAEDLARFKAYFGSFKFLEWEDIVPPVIKISKDGTMATKIVQKRVRGTTTDANGKEVTEHTVFAWLEVLEKVDGKWRLVTIASTEKDGSK